MIDLLADGDARGYGVATALGLEGIPFRRIPHLEAAGGGLLVVARPLADAEHAALRGVPAVLVGPGAPADVAAFHPWARVVLDEPVWGHDVRRRAARHGIAALTVPAATIAEARGVAAEVLAAADVPDAGTVPAVVRAGRTIRVLLDVGAAFADLLGEAHAPAPRRRTMQGPVARAALAAYYRAPEAARRWAQRRGYAGLARRVADLGPAASTYPVDGTGWLLLELLKAALRAAGGPLVRLARWPAPFTSAAALTHDVEPTRFAHETGLWMLCARARRTGHPPTFGLVAGPAARWLAGRLPDAVRDADVLCHGLEHRGETLVGSEQRILARLEEARRRLAAQLGRHVAGFRSPRLDRSPGLLRALHRSGFAWDSSWPDVDRENVDLAGGGVRLCLPYRPPVLDAGGVHPSWCLELPVSAPDCIQPLFQGADLRGLRQDVRAKTAFVRDTGGLYVGIVHAGVFDLADARRRGAHLAFVHRLVSRPDVWLATAGQVARWWCARERVALVATGTTVEVENRGVDAVAGLTVIVERADGDAAVPLPRLAPGARVAAAVPRAAPPPHEVRP